MKFSSVLRLKHVPWASWLTLTPLESVIDVLMCGMSVNLLFAIITRLINARSDSRLTDKAPALHTAALFRGTSHAGKQ